MAEFTKPVIFKLGNEEYGVDIAVVNGIEKYQQVIPVPNSQSYILGLINLRGEVVPVYSLRRKFNLPDFSGNKDERKMIIVRMTDTLIALDVDSVSDIHDFSGANILNMPGIVRNDDIPYFDRVARFENRIIVLLDVERLLTREELESVKKMAEELSKES